MATAAPNAVRASLPRRGFQWDLARQTERLDWLLAQLPRYADRGYQELYLHLEDAVDYPSLPGVARPGAYAYRQLERLVAAAGRAGLQVVPIANLLGHTQYLIKTSAWRDLNELRAPDGSPLPQGQICPLHPRAPELAERLLRDLAPFCTAGKIHVGLDESYALGRHPLSRAEIAEVGAGGHFARYVARLEAQARGFGLRLGLWADMLALLPEAIPLLPSGIVAYDWYYHPFSLRPRIELRHFAEYDLAERLRRRGIEYWGCAMSGAFRHEPLPIFRERLANIADWWRRCRRVGAAGLLVTSWEGSRLAAELPAAVEAAAAGLWREGETDPRRLWAGGGRRLLGKAGAEALWEADADPFIGYGCWSRNDRWDGAPLHLPLGPMQAQARAASRRASRSGLPPAVRASLRFRAYLASRDAFVQAAGQGVWAARAALARGGVGEARRRLKALARAADAWAGELRAGRAAARVMWRRTRDRRIAGPNEKQVAADAARWRAWRRWLRAACARPERAAAAAPVAGAWQLSFTATQFSPALQKVAVEADGRDRFGLFLIEFRARSARPRARREWHLALPLAWEGPPAPPPRFRLAVRGFGSVLLGNLRLTDGVKSYRVARGEPKARVLGRSAPSFGWPDFDWNKDRGAWSPRFELSAKYPTG